MGNINSSEVQMGSNPWQDRGSIGLFQAIWQTIKYVLLKPGEFFDSLYIQDSIKEPYLFYCIVTFCTSVIALAIELLFKPNSGGLVVFIFGTLLVILVTLISIFIGSAILHLGVMIVGGNGGFKGTLNVIAYNASTSVFMLIPFVGGLISGIWSLVVGIKGFKRIHNLSTLRAVVAYFGLFFIVAIIALLAVIALPNLLRAKLSANDAAAKAVSRSISTAIETYALAKEGKYPITSGELTGYLSSFKSYDNKTVQGYHYAVDLNYDSYKIVAKPEKCGTTGSKIITIETGGVEQEKECR